MEKNNENRICVNKEVEHSEYNYGLAMLRIIMTFEVVLCHYWNTDGTGLPIYLKIAFDLRSLAVPSFMILSFYLVEKHAIEGKGLLKRIYRLGIPYCLWAVIYFVIMYFTKKDGNIGISTLLWQLAFGSSAHLCPQLWYQWDLLILTIVVFGCFRLLKKENAFYLLAFLAIIALFLQYSGLNYRLFGQFDYEQRYSLGRLAETLPYVFIGLFLAEICLEQKLKRQRWKNLLMLLMVVVICLNYSLFTNPEIENFGYAGTKLLLSAIGIFLIFLILPCDKIAHILKSIIKFLSKYSFGVYCLHFLMGKIMNIIYCNFGLGANRFTECILIFGVCYAISYLISIIPVKACKCLVE